jgi:hypothetical protein
VIALRVACPARIHSSGSSEETVPEVAENIKYNRSAIRTSVKRSNIAETTRWCRSNNEPCTAGSSTVAVIPGRRQSACCSLALQSSRRVSGSLRPDLSGLIRVDRLRRGKILPRVYGAIFDDDRRTKKLAVGARFRERMSWVD